MKMQEIEKLINNNQLDKAQSEMSKLGETFFKDAEYLYLRGKIFYSKKLYYIAIDTLLTASEFKKEDKIYNLIAKIYNILGNEELSKKISDPDLRLQAIDILKGELSGIYRKNKRIRCAIKFEEVIKVESKNINQNNKNKPLECLAIKCGSFINETYKIKIFFAGNSIITIISEVIEVALHDLGNPWNVKHIPTHKI